jgi:hypothetical protein
MLQRAIQNDNPAYIIKATIKKNGCLEAAVFLYCCADYFRG